MKSNTKDRSALCPMRHAPSSIIGRCGKLGVVNNSALKHRLIIHHSRFFSQIVINNGQIYRPCLRLLCHPS